MLAVVLAVAWVSAVPAAAGDPLVFGPAARNRSAGVNTTAAGAGGGHGSGGSGSGEGGAFFIGMLALMLATLVGTLVGYVATTWGKKDRAAGGVAPNPATYHGETSMVAPGTPDDGGGGDSGDAPAQRPRPAAPAVVMDLA